MKLGVHPLLAGFPEPWAVEWGEDPFGVFMGFGVGTAVQRMRWVPPGTFLMGSPEDEAGRWEDEGPQHEVTISRGFWLAETPCTQAMWEAVMGNNPSQFKTPSRPVERVSWEDCQLFVQKLNGLIPGLDVRLPTEAEWEYACRAGTTRATWVGNLDIRGENNAPVLDEIAWYGGNSGHGFELNKGYDSSQWPNKQYPHTKAGTRPVGLKKPNPWGLHDMLGNVLEWCSDWSGAYSAASVVDPTGSVMGSLRVYRGGSWSSGARGVRAAYRYARTPGDRDGNLGFRLARGEPRWARSANVRIEVEDAGAVPELRMSGRAVAPGAPVDAIAALEAKIVDLRHKLRAGGQLSAGETLGNYVLVSPLGRGGFATVWKARDEQTSTDVAIKVLHLQFAQDVERRERFFRGARVMHSLDHPNIVRVLVPEGHDRGFDYFVMELVPGGTLREAVLRGHLEQRRIPEVLLSLCDALSAAHAAGHVHRDVKPANILLDEHGAPKLADFDLVGGENTTGGTRTGAMGTFVYAAPEAMERPQEADERADIYSLGMTGVFCWHGAELSPGRVMRNLAELIQGLPCDEATKRALARATEWDASDRFAEVSELRDALTIRARMASWAAEQGEDEFGTWVSFRVGTAVQRMRWVPPGTFTMGSPADEAGRYSDEGPPHKVTLTKGFWLAETPCTQALWEGVMGSNPSYFKSPNRPVEQVSWDDCQVFVQKLNGMIPGLDVRLPTEAEWEYACRAGTKQATWVGDLDIKGDNNAPILDEIAWYSGNSGHGFELNDGWDSSNWPDKQYPHTKAGTRPVGLKKPNLWGLHDMLGSVLEWCSDWSGAYSAASVVDPTGPAMGSVRVIRGGSWFDVARRVRAANRGAVTPDDRDFDLGFRLARGQTSK